MPAFLRSQQQEDEKEKKRKLAVNSSRHSCRCAEELKGHRCCRPAAGPTAARRLSGGGHPAAGSRAQPGAAELAPKNALRDRPYGPGESLELEALPCFQKAFQGHRLPVGGRCVALSRTPRLVMPSSESPVQIVDITGSDVLSASLPWNAFGVELLLFLTPAYCRSRRIRMRRSEGGALEWRERSREPLTRPRLARFSNSGRTRRRGPSSEPTRNSSKTSPRLARQATSDRAVGLSFLVAVLCPSCFGVVWFAHCEGQASVERD